MKPTKRKSSPQTQTTPQNPKKQTQKTLKKIILLSNFVHTNESQARNTANSLWWSYQVLQENYSEKDLLYLYMLMRRKLLETLFPSLKNIIRLRSKQKFRPCTYSLKPCKKYPKCKIIAYVEKS